MEDKCRKLVRLYVKMMNKWVKVLEIGRVWKCKVNGEWKGNRVGKVIKIIYIGYKDKR